jgi:hypothetical protein
VQKVLDHLRDVMKDLPFTTQSFCTLNRASSNVNVLEYVLRDVRLHAREIEVCKALHAWAVAADEDEEVSSEEEEEEAAGAAAAAADTVAVEDRRLLMAPQKLLDVDSRLLKLIDLSALSAEDLCNVRPTLPLLWNVVCFGMLGPGELS